MDCPRCCLPADKAGVVSFSPENGPPEEMMVYQCPRCTESVELFGVAADVAKTFALTAEGRLLDGRRLRDALPHQG